MKVVITKNAVSETTAPCVDSNENKLINAISNIPTEKLEEFVAKVVEIATQHNKTFETDKENLKYGVQVAPKRIKNCSLHVYGVGSLYAFEVSMIANELKFSVHSCPAGSVISRDIESEEMQQLFEDFLRENIENYDVLLQEEFERVNKIKNEEELSR